MTNQQNQAPRCRIEGFINGVAAARSGALYPVRMGRMEIADLMGWQDSGRAVPVITGTLRLLAEGKAVKLTSHNGHVTLLPLRDDEDGSGLPASLTTVYTSEGQTVEQWPPRSEWRPVDGS
ncbi:MAG TPA: hypothetical protein DCQ64_20305 [Candidatus Rokubacteria bacterium]|nr:hypothetical protein [Candidatus Rokubacteria bacterium]